MLFSGYNHGVDYLIVNGSIVVSQGKLVHVDEEALAEAANKAARKLLSKAGVHMPW
ncbi:MAG TPA: hypothetical protein PK025_02770 [Spirochaetales bacterium]|nr:hypothetical protein [Spirochaetales bacterium]